jgi:hypothetical protein
LYGNKGLTNALDEFSSVIGDEHLTDTKRKDIETMVRAVEYYHTKIFPLYVNRVEGIEIDDSIIMKGIDVPVKYRIDLSTLDGEVVDHKTVGFSVPDLVWSKQLHFYAYVQYKLTGRIPRKLSYHYAFKSLNKTRYNPQGLPVVTMSVTPRMADVMRVAMQMTEVYNRIKLGMFAPNFGVTCRDCGKDEECDRIILNKMA